MKKLALLPLLITSLHADTLTVDSVQSQHNALAAAEFQNDYPTEAASAALMEELTFQRATQAYLWSLPLANMIAMKEGHEALMDGEGYYKLGVYEERLKPNTLITTPNSDVIYGLGWINMKEHGPMILDASAGLQGLIDDMWHKALVGPINENSGLPYKGDIGLPGPDMGKGGKYLLLPPGHKRSDYDESKYFIYESDTYDVFLFLRTFFKDPSNLAPAVEAMEQIKVYPLKGKKHKMEFHHLSNVEGNSIAPRDWTYFAMVNRQIQKEEFSTIDPYMNGVLASLGIRKGVEFNPSDAQKALLTRAVQTGWKMAKNVASNFDELSSPTTGETYFWKESKWAAHGLLKDGNMFGAVIDTEYNDKESGHTIVDAKAHMFINHYSMSNGMISSFVDKGAKYAVAYKSAEGDYLDGSNQYTITLPKDVPAGLFWSITAYDADTAAGIQSNNTYPSIGSRDNPVKNKDGSTTLYLGPTKPAKAPAANYLHTPKNTGWFSLIRLYGPGKSFFDRTWIPGDFIKQ